MMNEGGTEESESEEVTAWTIYRSDPVARCLMEQLALRKHTLAMAALAWSLTYLLVLPAVFGGLRSRGGYLGSVDDWHAQLLLLLVLPAACAFYLWQPRAIAGVYEAIPSRVPSEKVGRPYRRRTWYCLSLILAVAVVIFDLPKMMAEYGSWWMAHNWLTIAGREMGLAFAFYITSMMAWRQAIATVEWRHLLRPDSGATVMKAVSSYALSCALLLALVGLRLSIEGIELPQRAGTITPDYYVKITVYVAASLACFFAPMGSVRRSGLRMSLDRAITLLELLGIMAIPLLAFIVLKLALGG